MAVRQHLEMLSLRSHVGLWVSLVFGVCGPTVGSPSLGKFTPRWRVLELIGGIVVRLSTFLSVRVKGCLDMVPMVDADT